MKFRALSAFLAFGFALAPFTHASEEGAVGGKRPGLLSRVLDTLNPLNDGASKKEKEGKGPSWKRLALTMAIEPLPLKLPETRQMKVTLQLVNKSRRFVQLEFPTTQRIEVLVRNKAGRMVEQWSEDQRFESDASLVTINPGERLEYAAIIATRDMAPGESYSVEGFFPNYEALRTQKTVVPEK